MIPLRNNYGAVIAWTLVDDFDYPVLSLKKWFLTASKQYVAGCFKQKNGKYIQVKLHRFILKANKSQMVDHINGNSLDNRRKNLRFCESYQNSSNTKIPSNNTSGFKGIYPTKRGNWGARIQSRGKRIFLGYFNDPVLAASIYNKASKRMHGAFARLNDI